MQTIRTGGDCRRRLAVVVVAALAASGCGARWDDDQRAHVLARAEASAAVSPAATPRSAAGTGGPTASTVAPGADDEVVGAAAPIAGPADGPQPAGTSAAGAAPACAAPSDAPGVGAEELSVGSISSLTGPVAGLGASSAAAVRAYVAYRNATGGVCGRRIALQEVDDHSDSARYRSMLRELAPRVLAFAGGLTIADDGSADIIEAEALPMVASRSAEGVQGLPTVFDLNPPFADLSTPIGKYDHLVAQGAGAVALAYLAVDASRAEAQIQRSLMEASGMRIVDVQELPISTLSFDSAARRVANSGADYLFFIGEAGSNASMARSMAETGYELRFEEYFTFAYGERFVEMAGAASEGAITWLRTLPNEEAASNPELAAFVEWMDLTAPGVPKDAFAAESWVAMKALLDGLEALPGPITRQAIVDHLRATDTYDAGGMLGPIRLGPQINQGCAIGLQVRGGVWQRMAPASGFLC